MIHFLVLAPPGQDIKLSLPKSSFSVNKRDPAASLCALGRVDQLTAAGSTDALLRSLARFGRQVSLVEGYGKGHLAARAVRQIGPDLAFGRLWQTTGIRQVVKDLLQSRRFEFLVERATYLTALHRLFESGSDRACERWKRDLRIPGTEDMKLHHLYRAMRWLGDSKDIIEEALFHKRRDLFSEFTLASFDTTSIYFEGQGSEEGGGRCALRWQVRAADQCLIGC